MIVNQKILQNFNVYDVFLSRLNSRDKEIVSSLKMMYSIHLPNNEVDKKPLFIVKQLLRFVVKLVTLLFFKSITLNEKSDIHCAILENTNIEVDISKKMDILLVKLNKKLTINYKSFTIYKELFRCMFRLFKDESLNKRYILVLLHRLIDYLLVYHTVDISDLKTILIENDRTPINLALVHKCKKEGIKTIKYDNWLIDPINHNDIYCEYYFYPSLYHKKIIENFDSNKMLNYIQGGFLSWDSLNEYTQKNTSYKEKIIYFSQFGILINQHKEYISDIKKIMDEQERVYEFIVKIHPREDKKMYHKLLKEFDNIEIIATCSDIYKLIAESDFCFSIFSTISLEAKHILNNSYFINYNYNSFDIVNYNDLKLDVIKDRDTLRKVLNNNFKTISQKEFIKNANCKFPNTLESLKKVCDD